MVRRRARLARIHMRDQGAPSIEGVLIGRRRGGHYVLEQARLIESADRSVQLDGRTWIPVERVLLVQELHA